MASNGFEELDIHRMTAYQASAAIDAKLRRISPSCYRLRIIHGYHGGTALRDMVRERYSDHPRVKRVTGGLNPGQTDLILRDLF